MIDEHFYYTDNIQVEKISGKNAKYDTFTSALHVISFFFNTSLLDNFCL